MYTGKPLDIIYSAVKKNRARTRFIYAVISAAGFLAACRFARHLPRLGKTVPPGDYEELKFAVLDSLDHDIKMPLTAIKAALSTLKLERGSDDAETALLDVAVAEADNLERIVVEAIELRRRLYEVREMIDAVLGEFCRDYAVRVGCVFQVSLSRARVNGGRMDDRGENPFRRR